jgi:S1-C subfamily serine protease
MAPPPERGGGGFGGVFLVFIVLAVVLAGTIALGHGAADVSSALGRFNPFDGGGFSPSVASAPVAVRPVSGPLTRQDALSLQRTVGPALVNVTADLSSQHAIGAGTGIVLSSSGEILTNNHVIRGASAVKVTDIGNGRTYAATVVGYDPKHDIAVLQARGASGLRTARIGDSDGVQVGDYVAAIGNAGGVGGKPSVATGPVTDLNRTIKTSDELTGSTERLTGLIEANADIRPGDSGGPMVTSEGQVIGVDVAASVDSKTDQPNGTGYAIPINDALAIVQQIRGGASTEQVHVGRTGVLGVMVTGQADHTSREVMAQFASPRQAPDAAPTVDGAYVALVSPGSPADSAGLQSGDVVTAVDGRPVDSSATLNSQVLMHRPGDRLVVTWTEPTGGQRSAPMVLAPAPPS